MGLYKGDRSIRGWCGMLQVDLFSHRRGMVVVARGLQAGVCFCTFGVLGHRYLGEGHGFFRGKTKVYAVNDRPARLARWKLRYIALGIGKLFPEFRRNPRYSSLVVE